MKIRTLLIPILFFLGFCSANGQLSVGVGIFNYYENGQPYVEANMHFVGSTLTPKKVGENLVQVEVLTSFAVLSEKGDTILSESYQIKSPETREQKDFIDIQSFIIEPGNYSLNITFSDVLDLENNYTFSEQLNIPLLNNQLIGSKTKLISDIAQSTNKDSPFYKYGFSMEPAVYQFYHRFMNVLYAYKEFYNLNKSSTDSLKVDIKILENDVNAKVVKYLSKDIVPKDKNVLIEGFNIDDLPSGNYLLTIDVYRDKFNFNKDTVYFQRSNPELDTKLIAESGEGLKGSFVENLSNEELVYSLKGLTPRLSSQERGITTTLLNDENYKGIRNYLYGYWVSFDPINTSKTFDQYQEIIEAVDKRFYSAYGRGFETDRGYIFLRYGKPNNVITVEDEPSAPPYEIWFYDWVDRTGQSNVKFLFYNPNLGAYHYELLHSTCRGEIFNKQWELELYRSVPGQIDGNPVDATTVQDNFNRRARQYFEDQN